MLKDNPLHAKTSEIVLCCYLFYRKNNRKLLIINFIKLLSHFLRKIGIFFSLISCCFLIFFKITIELLQRFQLFYVFSLLLSCQSLTLFTLPISKHAIGHVQFVEEMVKMMEPKDLELQNKYSNTALCFAAASGIVRIAEVMVKKNENLPMIQGGGGMIPLHMAALLGHSEMVRYLYNKTVHEHLAPGDWSTNQSSNSLFVIFIHDADVALDILHHHPALAVERDENDETALHLLARKPSAFSGGDQLHMWNTFINSISCNKEEQKKKSKQTQALRLVKHLWQQVRQRQPSEISDLIRRPSPLLLVAAELGNTVFLTELVGSYPDLIWEADNDNRTIFHIAVLHRRESIFNLIYEIGSMKDLIVPYKDDNDNNMLHLAGRKAPLPQRNIVSGAALQMQRELLWFKEVEKIMLPTYRERKNKDGKTPRDLFTKEHKNLMKDGEKWMRGTAAQSMLVATLIATVVFAAAFTCRMQ
ncbi:unnamed protein product, partial [Vitis vinifera]